MRIVLIGNGRGALKRLEMIDEMLAIGADIGELVIYADEPIAPLFNKLKGREISYLPKKDDLTNADIVFIADLDEKQSKMLYNAAKKEGALVNVEDCPQLCDFHVPAIVRRGDLLLTASTNGKSPRVASYIRKQLEETYPMQWSDLLDYIGEERKKWIAEGDNYNKLIQKTDAILDEKWI